MKKEIIALVDKTGVDGQQQKKQRWIGVLRLVAWKDTTLHTEEKIVNWVTTYDGLVDMTSRIEKHSIVKLLVEDKGSYFTLLDVVQAPAVDEELTQLQQQAKKPVYYTNKTLGRFKYDKQFDWYTKKVGWGNEVGIVTVHNVEPAKRSEQFAQLAALLQSQQLQQIKQFAAEQIAQLTAEWSGKALSVADLLNELHFEELVLHETGDFTVHLSSRTVFGEHSVQVEGHVFDGLKSASL